MPSLSEPAWQIQNNGQEYGPYVRARILEMLASGDLPDTAAIRQQGMPDWLPVPAARRLFQSYQAAGGTLAAAQAPEPPLMPDAQGDAAAADAMPGAWDDAVDFESPPVPPLAAAGRAPSEEGAKPATRPIKPFLYAGMALLVLAAAWWFFGSGDPVGATGYAKVKEELVHRMDDWRDRGIRLESVSADAVEGPLVRYAVEPPQGPVGEKDASYTFVVHCTFRDRRGVESESKMTVTMGARRMRVWNLFSR